MLLFSQLGKKPKTLKTKPNASYRLLGIIIWTPKRTPINSKYKLKALYIKGFIQYYPQVSVGGKFIVHYFEVFVLFLYKKIRQLMLS